MEERGSQMAEDYVTLIWKAYEWPNSLPTTGEIAQQLGVNASTVSGNLRRLAADGLINYKPYGAITLTATGEELAIRTIYRHRVLETYLATALGLGWAEVHEEADRLEHAASDKLINRMDDILGTPTSDPHGDIIPRGQTPQTPEQATLLIDAKESTTVRVLRVADTTSQILVYLSDLEICLGATLFVEEISANTGLVTISHSSGTRQQLPWQVAAMIRVLPL